MKGNGYKYVTSFMDELVIIVTCTLNKLQLFNFILFQASILINAFLTFKCRFINCAKIVEVLSQENKIGGRENNRSTDKIDFGL